MNQTELWGTGKDQVVQRVMITDPMQIKELFCTENEDVVPRTEILGTEEAYLRLLILLHHEFRLLRGTPFAQVLQCCKDVRVAMSVTRASVELIFMRYQVSGSETSQV